MLYKITDSNVHKKIENLKQTNMSLYI